MRGCDVAEKVPLGRWEARHMVCNKHESTLVPKNFYTFEVSLDVPDQKFFARFQTCRHCGSLFCVKFNDEEIGTFTLEEG